MLCSLTHPREQQQVTPEHAAVAHHRYDDQEAAHGDDDGMDGRRVREDGCFLQPGHTPIMWLDVWRYIGWRRRDASAELTWCELSVWGRCSESPWSTLPLPAHKLTSAEHTHTHTGTDQFPLPTNNILECEPCLADTDGRPSSTTNICFHCKCLTLTVNVLPFTAAASLWTSAFTRYNSIRLHFSHSWNRLPPWTVHRLFS